ncbi:hypothetical protein ACIGXM_28510, partial [Kitasatospora sp. NPDC052896]
PTPGGERSDASGLLEHTTEPWTGEADGETAETGTTAGGEGLTLPIESTAPESALTGETATAGEGMPYLPGTGGGTAAQTPTPGGERSDASGLLEHTTEPWTGEADGETAETGTTAGGEGLTLPFFPGPFLPEGEHARHRRTATVGSQSVEEAAAVQAESDSGHAAEAEEPTEREHASEHAAAIALPPTAGDDDSTVAWDVAGAAFAPLLWAASTEDEADVTADGPATADEDTWGIPASNKPSFTTWQPNRAGEAAASPAAAALAGATLACATDDIPPDPEEEPPAESADEEAPARGAADLLVQERDLWGSSDSEGLGAII